MVVVKGVIHDAPVISVTLHVYVPAIKFCIVAAFPRDTPAGPIQEQLKGGVPPIAFIDKLAVLLPKQSTLVGLLKVAVMSEVGSNTVTC